MLVFDIGLNPAVSNYVYRSIQPQQMDQHLFPRESGEMRDSSAVSNFTLLGSRVLNFL